MATRVSTSSLFYVKVGHGSKNLLLFHGFGQSNHVFHEFAHILGDTYTCYLFDLYFHGKSEWTEDTPVTLDAWHSALKDFIDHHHIINFSVLGYSLGAKFAFATLKIFPTITSELFLLAPDGIKTSFWYSLATYPVVFRKFFKSMIDHPQRFFKLSNVLLKIGILDKGVVRFAEHQMDTEEKRLRVYKSWVLFRLLAFDMRDIARMINNHHISTTVIVGKYDKVIKAENMRYLLKHVHLYDLDVVDAGHNHLITEAVAQLVLKQSLS